MVSIALVTLVVAALVLGPALIFLVPGLSPFAPRPSCPVASGAIFTLTSPDGPGPYPMSWTNGSVWGYEFSFVHCAPSDVNATWLAFQTVGPACTPATGVISFLLADAQRQPLATENATSLAWTGNVSAALPATGYLTETSTHSLSGDLLLLFVGGSVETAGYDSFGLAGRC